MSSSPAYKVKVCSKIPFPLRQNLIVPVYKGMKSFKEHMLIVSPRPLLLVTFGGGLGGRGPGLCMPLESSTLCVDCIAVQFSIGRSEKKLPWPHREKPAPGEER